MGMQFVKGWTNNHLTWVMVDATDCATPESALSAATKIRKYGKLKGDGTVYTVGTSGQGSLTNAIKHVGASATGIYTIALVKADLSAASAAWYDQYIFDISAAGAARQTIIVDGGIWISDLSAIASEIRSDVSDMHSDLIVMSGILRDTYSAVLLAQSLASDAHSAAAQANSRVLVTQSLASDAYSAAVEAQTLNASDLSDIASRVWSAQIYRAFCGLLVRVTAQRYLQPSGRDAVSGERCLQRHPPRAILSERCAFGSTLGSQRGIGRLQRGTAHSISVERSRLTAHG